MLEQPALYSETFMKTVMTVLLYRCNSVDNIVANILANKFEWNRNIVS